MRRSAVASCRGDAGQLLQTMEVEGASLIPWVGCPPDDSFEF